MNYRIFVEKKKNFRVEAQSLLNDLKDNLSVKNLENVRILNIYDIFNLNEKDLKKLNTSVFSEINADDIYYYLEDVLEETGVKRENEIYFATEFLPGQYDQRADSAVQCINLLSDSENVAVKSGKLIILYGKVSEEDIKRIKKYYINEVEMKEKDLAILIENREKENTEKVPVFKSFREKSEKEMEEFKKMVHEKR